MARRMGNTGIRDTQTRTQTHHHTTPPGKKKRKGKKNKQLWTLSWEDNLQPRQGQGRQSKQKRNISLHNKGGIERAFRPLALTQAACSLLGPGGGRLSARRPGPHQAAEWQATSRRTAKMRARGHVFIAPPLGKGLPPPRANNLSLAGPMDPSSPLPPFTPQDATWPTSTTVLTRPEGCITEQPGLNLPRFPPFLFSFSRYCVLLGPTPPHKVSKVPTSLTP